MQRDTRRKVESCIMQIFRERDGKHLLQKQIAHCLAKYGFFPSEYELRGILQDMWQGGMVQKYRDSRDWKTIVRYKLNTQSETISIVEIVERIYHP